MRFILNFVFYGILFYLIYLSFPDIFFMLVTWAEQLTELLKEFYNQITSKVHDWKWQKGGATSPHAQYLLFLWLMTKFNPRQ